MVEKHTDCHFVVETDTFVDFVIFIFPLMSFSVD